MLVLIHYYFAIAHAHNRSLRTLRWVLIPNERDVVDLIHLSYLTHSLLRKEASNRRCLLEYMGSVSRRHFKIVDRDLFCAITLSEIHLHPGNEWLSFHA